MAFTLHPADSLYPYAAARGHGASAELNDLVKLAESTDDLLQQDGLIDDNSSHQLVTPLARARTGGFTNP